MGQSALLRAATGTRPYLSRQPGEILGVLKTFKNVGPPDGACAQLPASIEAAGVPVDLDGSVAWLGYVALGFQVFKNHEGQLSLSLSE